MSSENPSSIEITPADYCAPLDWAVEFATARPLEIDIGCGDGAFLMARAQCTPERNFLGIERLYERVKTTCAKAERLRLPNVRLLAVESAYAVQFLVPPASVRIFHLSFPDPWPKRRHWDRRLMQPAFLAAIHTALEPGGELRVKTDDAAYFAQMQTVFAAQSALQLVPWEPAPTDPITTFESHFIARGLPIYGARLLKI